MKLSKERLKQISNFLSFKDDMINSSYACELADHITALESEIAKKDARIAELEKVVEAVWNFCKGCRGNGDQYNSFGTFCHTTGNNCPLASLNEKERRA